MKKQEEKHEKENFGSDGRDSDGTWNDDVSRSRGSKSRFTSSGSGFGNTVKEFREWVKSL